MAFFESQGAESRAAARSSENGSGNGRAVQMKHREPVAPRA
jgi:hypothetical protein